VDRAWETPRGGFEFPYFFPRATSTVDVFFFGVVGHSPLFSFFFFLRNFLPFLPVLPSPASPSRASPDLISQMVPDRVNEPPIPTPPHTPSTTPLSFFFVSFDLGRRPGTSSFNFFFFPSLRTSLLFLQYPVLGGWRTPFFFPDT